MNAAAILAGGSGTRMQGEVADKVLVSLAGRPLLRYSIDAFVRSGVVDTLVLVYRDVAQRSTIGALTADLEIDILWALGGSQRQDSVHAALSALPARTELVLIHDGARPLITPEAIRDLADSARECGAACLAHPVTDTLKRAEPAKTGHTLATVDRSALWAMETPQAFSYPMIRKAYERVIAEKISITDDLSAIEAFDQPVALVQMDSPNPKLTTPKDLPYLEFLVRNQNDPPKPIKA